MAGSQDPNENPVAVNVIPMVDVIFCLCVFFMCSFKFKQLEGKLDSWLPRNKGTEAPVVPAIEELRIALTWDPRSERVQRHFGRRTVDDDAELETLLRGAHQDARARGAEHVPVTLDGDVEVPWADVLRIVDLCKGLGIEDIEFALGRKRD